MHRYLCGVVRKGRGKIMKKAGEKSLAEKLRNLTAKQKGIFGGIAAGVVTLAVVLTVLLTHSPSQDIPKVEPEGQLQTQEQTVTVTEESTAAPTSETETTAETTAAETTAKKQKSRNPQQKKQQRRRQNRAQPKIMRGRKRLSACGALRSAYNPLNCMTANFWKSAVFPHRWSCIPATVITITAILK